MKKLLLIQLSLLFSPLANAQYKVDWANTPVNPIPYKYTRNHLNIRGNVKSRSQEGTTFNFDNNGNFTKVSSMFPTTYYYDKNGFLRKGVSYGTSLFYETDGQGRVIQESTLEGDGSKFLYDEKGLWISSSNIKNGKINQKNEYDAAGRIKKLQNFLLTPFVENYSYKKIGENLEVKIVKTADGKPTKTDIALFNQKGDRISFNGNKMDLEYDEHENILSATSIGKINFNYTYYENSADKNSSTTTICKSGDCINGVGSKKIGDYTYIGFFVFGKTDGPGILMKNDYQLISTWKNGENIGYGFLIETGNNSQGYFKNNILNGRGLMGTKGNFRYGIFSNGKSVEEYKFINNKTEKGCIIGNCEDYYGRYLFEDGSKFTGFFKNNNPESGIFSTKDGNQYSGEFNAEGKKNGIGKQVFANGDMYFGSFKNGKRNGKGMIISKQTKATIEIWGEWIDDVLVKKLSSTSEKIPPFSPTPPGPGKMQNSVVEKTSTTHKSQTNSTAPPEKKPSAAYSFSDLGFGDAAPDSNTLNNTGAISRIYPGYPSSDKKFISKKISAEAAKKNSDEAQSKFVAEKIQELYFLNKMVAYETWSSLKPDKLVVESQKFLTAEQRTFFKKEAKKIVDEFLKKNPQYK